MEGRNHGLNGLSTTSTDSEASSGWVPALTTYATFPDSLVRASTEPRLEYPASGLPIQSVARTRAPDTPGVMDPRMDTGLHFSPNGPTFTCGSTVYFRSS